MTDLDRAVKDALVLGLENDPTAENILRIATPFIERAFQDQEGRIEKLEAALRDCINVLACFERPDFYQLEQTSPIKPYALGALDVARKALEGKDD